MTRFEALLDHGEDDRDGVDAGAGDQIVIRVGAMYSVQAPQYRNGVHNGVLKSSDEVQGDDRL